MRLIILFCLMFACSAVYAVTAAGIGMLAENVMEPVSILSDFTRTACFVIGGGFVFGAIIKYIEHRRNPLVTPVSTIIFLFVAGLLLIGIPLLSHVVQG